MLNIGCVYHDPNFKFSDGEDGNKLFVVLGKDDDAYTVAKTTSQQHKRTTSVGCQGLGSIWHSWFHPGSHNRCFLCDTWLCLDELYTLRKTSADAALRAGLIVLKCGKASLVGDLCLILECALKSDDISGVDEKRLQSAQITLGCISPPP